MRRSAAGGWRVTPGCRRERTGTSAFAGGSAALRLGLACAALLMAASFLLGAVGTAVPAGAVGLPEAYPPPPVGLQLSQNVVLQGESLTVFGQGWAAGHQVALTLFSDPTFLGNAVTNGAGNFSQLVTVPSNEPLGLHTVVATGPSLANPAQTLTLSAQLTVIAPTTAVATPSHALPFTGFASRTWLVASLAFILAGAALVLRAHKRRQHRAL